MTEKSEIELKVIEELELTAEYDSLDFSKKFEFDHNDVVSYIKSFESREIITVAVCRRDVFSLTESGVEALGKGSPEFRVLEAVGRGVNGKDGIERELGKETASNGINECMKNKFLHISKTNTGVIYEKTETGNTATNDPTRDKITSFTTQQGSSADLAILKRRKFIKKSTKSSFSVRKGPKFAQNRTSLAPALTSDMVKSGEWAALSFKKYNFSAKGILPQSGCLHPLLKVRAEFRDVFVEMGFEEMDTAQFVESSFWNFDALFQPQQHPARDAHDTFFLSSPEASQVEEDDAYVAMVRETHENGAGFGSIGWRYKWSIDEARKNILRTHTTAVSARTLYRLAKETPFRPMRYFSIDRVFRNETIDATHLAEFHQVEGVVIDRNLSLGDLIGVVSHFFARIGIPGVKFKPAYNPYTEPSMEIFGFSKELNKWIEVGNSGMFRPEMLRPMGFDEDVNAIAWGLSLERPTMIKYGLGNIRDLFGHKMDLNLIKKSREVMYCGVSPPQKAQRADKK